MGSSLRENLSKVMKAFGDMNEWLQAQAIESDKDYGVNGVAWILRNEDGLVVMHIKISFMNIRSNVEAHGNGWIWATGMTRSPAWLSFRWLSSKIIGSWRLWISGSWKNVSKQLSGPLFIAKSVIDKNFAMWLMASLISVALWEPEEADITDHPSSTLSLLHEPKPHFDFKHYKKTGRFRLRY
ncbi:hypothetical protein YC2023_107610 [Brassica napus]